LSHDLFVPLTLRTGTFPTDAWITFAFGDGEAEVIGLGDWSADGDTDFEPVFCWAADCSLGECPPPPPGWTFEYAQEQVFDA